MSILTTTDYKTETHNLIVSLSKFLSHVNHVETDDELSLIGGLPGVSLALFHSSNYLNNEDYRKHSLELLQYCTDNIELAYDHTYGRGNAGIFTLIQYFINNTLTDIDFSLEEVDKLFLKCIEKSYIKKDYDFFTGIIGYIQYFQHRGSEEILIHAVKLLEKLSVSTTIGISWVYTNVYDNKSSYNLGLAHGHTSILAAMNNIYSSGVSSQFKEYLYRSIGRTSEFLLNVIGDIKTFGGFSTHIELSLENLHNQQPPARLAWCYGDLGVSWTLYKSGQITGDNTLQEEAIEIAKRTTLRNLETSGVFDASICHGIAGVITIYTLFYRQTNDRVFIDAIYKWLKLLFCLYDNKGINGFDYYISTTNKHIPHVGLLEGYAGVLLALLLIQDDTETNSNWTKFMLL